MVSKVDKMKKKGNSLQFKHKGAESGQKSFLKKSGVFAALTPA